MYLGLGTNLGDRAHNLRAAVHALESIIQLDAQSAIYESDAVGYTDQPRFWNMVVRARTDLDPRALLARVKQLEIELGRTPTFAMGPRVIDIDVLLYDAAIIDEPGLRIPHPRMHERAFVLQPLLDIDDSVRHPESGRALSDQLSAIPPQPLVCVGTAAEVLGASHA